MKKQYRIAVLVLLCLFSTPAFAQLVNGEAFLQGDFVEVGIADCGTFGTRGNAPAGYHPRTGGFGGPDQPLGFVADPDRDGWDIGTPDYCGDYFLPGSPEEGFSIEIDSINYGNFGRCGTNGFPGGITNYQLSASQVEATWQGDTAGIQVTARTYIPLNKLYFVTQVRLENISADTLREVFYMRNVDPDNEAAVPMGGGFSTQNTVVFQQPAAADQKALVEAIGGNFGCYLGLGTKDSTARVTFGRFSNRSAGDIWRGISQIPPDPLNPGDTLSASGSKTGDIAISIAFRAGDIPPGECVILAFAYILDPADLDEALEATQSIQITANNANITDSLATPALCPGLSQDIEILNADDYNWTWSPTTGLNTALGPNVVATPLTTTTYTATGISTQPCIPDVTVQIEVRVKPTPEVEIRTTDNFRGDTLRRCDLDGLPTALLVSDSSYDNQTFFFWRDLDDPSITLNQTDSLPILTGLSDVRSYEILVVDSGIVDVCNNARDTMTISMKKEPEPDISVGNMPFDTLRFCDREGAIELVPNNPFHTPTTKYEWVTLVGDTLGTVGTDSVFLADDFSDSVVVELIVQDTALEYICETRDTAVIIFYPSSALQIGTGQNPPDTIQFCDSDGPQVISASDSVEGIQIRYFWRDITDPTNPVLVDTTRELTLANFSQTTVYEVEVITETPVNCGSLDTLTVVFVPNPDSLRITYQNLDTGDSLFFCQENGEQTLSSDFSLSLSDIQLQWYIYNEAQDTSIAIFGATTPNLTLASTPRSETLILELLDLRSPTACPIRDTVTVTFFQTPDLVLNDTTFICTGNEVLDVSQNEAFLYDWTGPNGFQDTAAIINPSVVGTYIVNIQNIRTTCRTSDTSLVTRPSQIPAQIRVRQDTTRLCAGDTVFLDAFDSLHTSDIRYRWNIGRGVASFQEVFSAGDQVVSIEIEDLRTGCLATDTVRFRVGNLPSFPNFPTVKTFCAPADTLDVGLAPNFLYEWTGTGILSDPRQAKIRINTEGTYTVTATDLRGLCPLSRSVEVAFNPLPFLDLPTTLEVCQDDTLSPLTAQDLTHGTTIRYRWYALTDPNTVLASSGVFRPDTSGLFRVEVEDTLTGCVSLDTARFTLRPTPQFDIYGYETPNCATSDTLFLLPSEVNGAAVLWPDRSTGLSFIPAETGRYAVTLTDTRFATRCTATRSQFVEIESLPELPDFPTDTLRSCATDSLRLDGFMPSHGATAYQWTNLNDGTTLSTSSALVLGGTAEVFLLELLVRDQNQGCEQRDTLVVQFLPTPTANLALSDTAICLGETVRASLSGAADFRWADGSTEPSRAFIPTEAGEFILRVQARATHAFCPDTSLTARVRVNDIPVSGLSQFRYAACTNDSLFLDAFSPENSALTSYHWTDTNGNTLATDSAFWLTSERLNTSEQLILTITDPERECEQIDTLTLRFFDVPQTEILANKRDTLCLGETETLQAQGAENYRWNTAATTSSLVFRAENEGWQTLIVEGRNENEACPAVLDTVFRFVAAPPVLRILPETETQTFCIGDTIELTASGAERYFWQDETTMLLGTSATLSFTLNEPTQLTLRGTNLSGCTAEVQRRFNLTPTPFPDSLVQACVGDAVTIGLPRVSTTATYFWQETALETPQIRVAEAGLYTLAITEGECNYVRPITVVLEALPLINLPSDTVFCPAENPLLLTANVQNPPTNTAVTWLWNEGTTEASLETTTAGTFAVEASFEYEQKACTSRAEIKVRAACEGDIFVPTAFSPNGDGLNERMVIFGENITRFRLQIYDRWGRLRYFLDKDFPQIETLDWWDGGNMPVGTYTWVIFYQTERSTTENASFKEQKGQITLIR